MEALVGSLKEVFREYVEVLGNSIQEDLEPVELGQQLLHFLFQGAVLVGVLGYEMKGCHLQKQIQESANELYETEGFDFWDANYTKMISCRSLLDSVLEGALSVFLGFSLEELVSAYEGLLEYSGERVKGKFLFQKKGSSRQDTASFYTPTPFVESLVETTLAKKYGEEPSPVLWQTRVVEPAVGCGAFLLEMVNRLATLYLEKSYEEQNLPLPAVFPEEEWERVTKHFQHRVYGVDIQPIAVYLAVLRVAQSERKGFGHRFRVGNSLLGVLREVVTPLQERKVLRYAQGLPKGSIYKVLLFFPEMLEGRTGMKFNPLEQGREHQEELEVLSLKLDGLWRRGEKDTLRLIFDYWMALWFWPQDKEWEFPTLREYRGDIRQLLKGAEMEQSRRTLVEEIAKKEGFFHWSLEFPEVFREEGGFPLVVSNPPWVQPDAKKGDPKSFENKRLRIFLAHNYPLVKSIRVNLYKCFIVRAWQIGAKDSRIGLLHPESVYEDPRADEFRGELYARLLIHYQFINELSFFPSVHHSTAFSLNVYQANPKDTISFSHIANLFHPETIKECFLPSTLSVPGVKEKRKWSRRGHPSRHLEVDASVLKTVAQFFQGKTEDWQKTRLLALHCQENLGVVKKIIEYPSMLRDIEQDVLHTQMWNETTAVKQGVIKKESCEPKSAKEWVVCGPHISIANPFFKSANSSGKNNLDYDVVDHGGLSRKFYPRSNYTKQEEREPLYFEGKPLDSYYRIVFRAMLGVHTERSLIGAIIPPGASHINALLTFLFSPERRMVLFAAFCCSLVYDFLIKMIGKTNLHDIPFLLPNPQEDTLSPYVIRRMLRLNCLTEDFADLFARNWIPSKEDTWSCEKEGLPPFGVDGSSWSMECPIRTPLERRQALLEIDALVALSLGLSLEELLSTYTLFFPVLQQYEVSRRYDTRGQIIKDKEGFTYCRKEDMAQAYQFFAKKM